MKIFFICLGMIFPLLVFSQNDTVYFQDFENYSEGDMILIDNDGLTPYYSSLATWYITGGHAISSSYYTDGDKTADDWMITPELTLGDNPGILWEAYTASAQYPEGYQILVSSNIADPEDLTSYQVVFSISAEETEWTQRAVDLSDYSNQTVRIAFRNNSTDEYLLYVDNIMVLNRKQIDLMALNPIVKSFVENGQNIEPNLELFNIGTDTIKNFYVSYSVDGGIEVSQQYFETIPFGSKVTVAADSYMPTNDTVYNLRFIVSSPNEQIDQNNSNDTIFAKFSAFSSPEQNYLLLEHFTQASCNPCAQVNPTINNLLSNNDEKVVHIAYHTSWPGVDVMYNYNPDDSDEKVDFYGISAVPNFVANGVYIEDYNDVNQQLIDDNYKSNSPVNIELNGYGYNDTLYMNVNLTAHTYFPKEFKLNVVVIEDKEYSTAPGSNGEKSFPDVMRKIIPEKLPLLVKDSVFSYNYTFYAGDDVDLNNSSFVVFIQDTINKEIVAVKQFDITDVTAIENVDLNNFSLYPNPANNIITVQTNDETMNSIDIYNLSGQCVIRKDNVNQNNIAINTSALQNGVYIIQIKSGDNIRTDKFVVKH